MQKPQLFVFGGSFDPFQNAHLNIVNALPGKVLLVPCGQHPFDKNMSSKHHRFAMVKLMETDRILISDFEVSKDGKSFTIDTLQYVLKSYPEYAVSLVIGMDTVKDFSKWKDYEKILQLVKVYVAPRAGVPVAALLPGMELLNQMHTMTESSSAIRQLIEQGKDFRHLVPPQIYAYIQEHKDELYTHHGA